MIDMSDVTQWILQRLRAASGSRSEGARDTLVHIAGRAMDLEFKRAGERGLHPLAKMTASHVGDPLEHWDTSDLDGFRAHFEELLAYLPYHVSSSIEDTVVQSAGQSVGLRVFTPDGLKRDGILVYLHGGGFVIGSERSNDPECDYLAQGLGCRVVAIGYPLSPESQYPVALTAVREQLERLASEDRLIALCGESAGCNLALAAFQASATVRERTCSLVFAYPMLDLSLASESTRELGSGYFLTRELLEWFIHSYAPNSSVTDPAVSPLLGDLTALPPTLTLAAAYDPLRGDAERLAASSSAVKLSVYPGMLHGFLQLRDITQSRTRALDEIISFVSRSCPPT
jgi:acetyl esterase/lipase